MRRALILFFVMTVLSSLSLLAGLVWLVGSPSGLQQLAQWAQEAGHGQLSIGAVDGRLRDRLDIDYLRWQSDKLDVEIRQLHLEWSPQALLSRHLELNRLALGELRVSTPPSEHPEPLPADLQWPFGLTVRLGQGAVGQLWVDGHEVAREIHGRYFSDARQHHVESLRWMSGDVAVEGQGILAEHAPFSLSGTWQLRGQLDRHPMALTLDIQGVLDRIQAKAVATQGVVGQAQAVITPWGALPYENLHVQLDQIDPASWHRDAPQARLSLNADIAPEAQGVSGRFALRNHQPGSVDHHLMPLIALSGYVRWENNKATFNDLMAQVSGGGVLSGKGQWRDRHLQLDLAVKQLDLEKVLSHLRPTRLTGGLTTTLGSDHQTFKLALRDERISQVHLEAEASLQGAHLKIPRLKLTAQEAQLNAQGEMHLDATRQFSASGQLQRFDPSRFAKLPSARFNADWQATGQLAPHPKVEARFSIRDSRIVQQALSGQGQLSLDWPRIPRLDVELKAGSNHVHVAGAQGQPGDRLTLNVDAPNLGELAELGLEGRLTGQGSLVGDLTAPDLNLKLSATQLAWRHHFRMETMDLSVKAGMRPAAPLNLDLTISRLDLPERPGLLQQFHLQGDGQLTTHRLRVDTDIELAGRNHLTLATQGGWNAVNRAWRGQIVDATLKTEDRARNLYLLQPTPLGLSAQAWQIGPATLSSSLLDGRMILQGHADAQQMQVEIQAEGVKIGQVKGELQAGMQGAWSLDKNARWQGKLHTHIPDLGWLADWVGEGWNSGGQLQGDVQVAGSPIHPVVSGRLQGSALSMRLPGQGLSLAQGVLDVDLHDNLLKIRRLEFESPLQPPPRALRLSSNENPDRWMPKTDKPGLLDITGEMRLDQQADLSDVSTVSNATHAWLELHLDRVGAWQRSDQWIVVSGRHRIGWKSGVLDVRGALTVDAGYWQLARMGVPRLSEDVHVRREGAKTSANSSPSSFRPRIDLDVTADLGQHFLFEGAGLTSGLSGQIRLTAQGRDLPRASGSIQARDGRFEAYGQKLDIERGVLRFNGLLDNPGLDVRAVRKGLAVEPGVQIGGTAQKPVVKLISDPDLPETEKLAWLVLGHGSEQMGVGDATVLLSAAGDLFGNDAGNVVGQLRKAVGIDEIGIRQGSLGDNGSRAPASRIAGGSTDAALAGNNQQIFSIGKRLSSNVLLSYEQAMGKAESLVKLTWSLSRQVSLIGRTGSDNAIDILYTLSFGKPTLPNSSNSSNSSNSPTAPTSFSSP